MRVYGFGPGADFGGYLVGALERLDDGQLLDALFVARDAGTEELAAIDLVTGHRDGTIARLLDFRLDPRGRRSATRRTLAAGRRGEPTVAEVVGDSVAPGCAVFAVTLAGGGVDAVLDEATTRAGGRLLDDSPAQEPRLSAMGPRICAAVERSPFGRRASTQPPRA